MNISFSATTEQFKQHRKHCTRRMDKSLWLSKKEPGTILQGIEKAQGLKKGEHVVKLDQIIILEVNREPLTDIIRYPFRNIPIEIDKLYQDYLFVSETTLEGFPQFSDCPEMFVYMFCEINDCEPNTEITRVLFDYQVRT
jgi:hypothetical protein